MCAILRHSVPPVLSPMGLIVFSIHTLTCCRDQFTSATSWSASFCTWLHSTLLYLNNSFQISSLFPRCSAEIASQKVGADALSESRLLRPFLEIFLDFCTRRTQFEEVTAARFTPHSRSRVAAADLMAKSLANVPLFAELFECVPHISV